MDRVRSEFDPMEYEGGDELDEEFEEHKSDDEIKEEKNGE
ncbi:hypothetical protein CANMA_004324, partial [Candida margitis]